MSRLPRILSAVALAAVLGGARAAQAQCISLTTLGSAYTQSFDTLSNTAGSTTNNLTITGWFMTETGGGARDNEQYAVDTGGSNTGDTYSYGAAASTERALGGLQSGTLIPVIGACFTNNTGSTINTLSVAYVGEQWRIGNTAAARDDRIDFQRSLDATSLTTGTWVDVDALDFTNPVKTAVTAGALDGNSAANRTSVSSTIVSLAIPTGATFWIRWNDFNGTGADDGLAVDDFSLTPDTTPGINVSINDLSLAEGNAGTTTFSFTVSLSSPAPAGGVTFDIATADGTAQDGNPVAEDNDYIAKSLPGQTIPAGSSTYNFDVLVNGDVAVEANETFFVNLTNATGTGVAVTDGQGQGTITNDDVALSFIHDVQGNGAATPLPGATVAVEGVVVANFQGAGKLQGFFLEEEDADFDADPATSEGIFIFCNSCPTPVAEGQRVRATGTVSEFFNMTEITATSAGAVLVTDAGNHLAEVTPSPIDLPVVGVIDDFYEPREGMLVTFVDALSVAEYFELFRYGQIELYEGGRPRQFTEANPPSVAGNAAHLDNLARRRVILDDENDVQNQPLTLPDGSQFVFHPRANGGFSVGTQGIDFFRGGDLVTGLTGVLHWSFAGLSGTDAWRVRPTSASPTAFTVANPRPPTPPAVGGAIKAAGMNLLNYFTTIDTTASSSAGPCGPAATLDCRGADSVAELNRQRERASIVVCGLNADVLAFMELENTTPSATITDLLGAINALCGGAHPYDFVNTGGTLGTDAIRVQQIYRTGILSPVASPLVDLDPVHNRPPTAQTFDVVDATNPAFGERFTVIANHFKSKGCPGTGADADAGDGQGCFNGTRTAQASRLLTWISGTVLPAAGDPDVLLLGDFNAYAQEDPVTTLAGGGFTDLESALLGPNAYSYLFDGQLGHLDYAFSTASLTAQVTGVGAWHINADEVPLFDYNDEVKDTGEAAFEEKPDGSALVPPRVVFQPSSAFRASDHDPVLVGLFEVADLSVTKVDSPDPVTAGNNIAYTITLDNAGPSDAAGVSLSDTLPVGTTFVSLASPPGWDCSAVPPVGSGGTVTCTIAALSPGSPVFTLTVAVNVAVPGGTVLTNTATAASSTADPVPGDESGSASTTVVAPLNADLSVLKVDAPDPVAAGTDLTYTIQISNEGPDDALTVTLDDPLPPGTTFVSLASPAGWGCTSPAVGSGGTVSCSIPTLPIGTATFTLVVHVDGATVAGTVLSNTATIDSTTIDLQPGDHSATALTTVTAPPSPALSLAKTDDVDPVAAGANLTYTIVASANNLAGALGQLDDTVPAGTTFVSFAAPAGWICSTPVVGGTGAVSCSTAALVDGDSTFTLVVAVGNLPTGTVLHNHATTHADTGARTADASADQDTALQSPANVTATKAASGTLVPGSPVTYTVTLANAGPGDQPDAPGDEFSDALPAPLVLVTATASSGTALATTATNTVTWNGAIPAGGSVTVTIQATLPSTTLPGTSISNQGSFQFDSDGDGTNDSPGVTDDPATGAADDRTAFTVAAPAAIEIPALGGSGIVALALLLSLAAIGLLRGGRDS